MSDDWKAVPPLPPLPEKWSARLTPANNLYHDEFLRLECLAQSVNAIAVTQEIGSTDTVLARAERFRQFVQNGTTS